MDYCKRVLRRYALLSTGFRCREDALRETARHLDVAPDEVRAIVVDAEAEFAELPPRARLLLWRDGIVRRDDVTAEQLESLQMAGAGLRTRLLSWRAAFIVAREALGQPPSESA